MPDVRKVLGTSPWPAKVNLGNLLYHSPAGTSGLEFSQSCNASKSETEIRPSRKRSTRCFMKKGGGFSILGIPILFVEHDLLKLFGQAPEFAFVFGFFDLFQTQVQSFPGSVEDGCSRRGLNRISFAKIGEFLGVHVFALKRSIVAACFGLSPSCLNGFACAGAAMFRRELGGSGRTTLFATSAA